MTQDTPTGTWGASSWDAFAWDDDEPVGVDVERPPEDEQSPTADATRSEVDSDS